MFLLSRSYPQYLDLSLGLKKIFTVTIFAFLSLGFANAQTTTKSEAIDNLMTVNQTKESTQQVIGLIIQRYLEQKPNAPKSLAIDIENEIDYRTY